MKYTAIVLLIALVSLMALGTPDRNKCSKIDDDRNYTEALFPYAPVRYDLIAKKWDVKHGCEYNDR